jgi:hypothetical protein
MPVLDETNARQFSAPSDTSDVQIPVANDCHYIYSAPVVATRTVSYDGVNIAPDPDFQQLFDGFSGNRGFGFC